MNISKRNLALVLLSASLIGAPVYAENWVAFSGAETLQQFVSGATAEIELRPDVTAIGKYFADGTAEIEAWDETFDRTWEVVGEDQVCYSSFTETNCYTFEQNLDTPNQYRSRHTETGEVVIFQVTSTNPTVVGESDDQPAAGGLASPSAEEIAAQLANPNSTLGTMNVTFDYVAYDGDLPDASNQDAVRATFQPSLPYPLSPTTNLFVRPAIPIIINQDVPNLGGGYQSKGVDLGDISFDSLIAKSLPIGAVVGVGVVGTIPTATSDALGLDQWLLGPEAIAAVVRKWGVVGILVSHQWDVAGEDDFDTSITGGQYFYAINLTKGWQLNGSPIYSYNHEAKSGDEWTLPIAIGLTKTSIINNRPWKFGVQYWHYIESPSLFGPDWQIRFTVSPVVALPW
jgi:hypothetical protein